ncbi:MAG: TetR/AcrR family transcriptional regulator [Deltaproteobacteria bacterium]|nr:TetR/AcrR family transcriptional regulator [Deltaproteobacteria bacterium]
MTSPPPSSPSPPTETRVEQKRVARTTAILDEAMAILSREGLEALTLGRLAKSLGYVPAALYRYFDSKDALLAALQRRAVVEIHEGLAEAERALVGSIEAARPTPEVAILARLVGAAQYYLDLPETNPQAAFLVALLMGDPRALLSTEESQRTAPLLLALLGEVDAMFREAEGPAGGRALATGASIERTLVFWASLSGALSLAKARRIAPELPSPALVGMAGVRALLVGWGAKPADVERAEALAAAKPKKKITKKERP